MHWGHCGRVMARPRLHFAADYGDTELPEWEGIGLTAMPP
jgi:hypothetical protein